MSYARWVPHPGAARQSFDEQVAFARAHGGATDEKVLEAAFAKVPEAAVYLCAYTLFEAHVQGRL